MQHALVIGVRDDTPHQALDTAPTLAVMVELLEDIGGWTITRVGGHEGTRARVLAELAALEGRVARGDECLIYFVGHGGEARFPELPGPLGRRLIHYLATAREPGAAWRLEGVLDVELSCFVAGLDRRGVRVSVILDCCHAALIARESADERPLLPRAPAWLRARAWAWTAEDQLLAADSHASAVRLAASSSRRSAYAVKQADGRHMCRMTRALASIVREAMPELDRLPWAALARRVREQVIWDLGCEDQWVSFAGPGGRILFDSVEVELPGAVAFVPDEREPGGWLRAGQLQGVAVDDEWDILGSTLDEALSPVALARMRVSAVELNRARVEPVGDVADDVAAETGSLRPGLGARLARAARASRSIVGLDRAARGRLGPALACSPWIAAGDEEQAELARVRGEGARLSLTPAAVPGLTIVVSDDAAGRREALAWLEDWRRADHLRTIAGQLRSQGDDARFSLRLRGGDERPGRAGPRDGPAPATHVGARVWFEVANNDTRSWFVTLVELGVDGRARLLNHSEAEGVELLGGDVRAIGRREHRRVEGFELRWPSRCPADAPRRVEVVMLASRRPLPLEHLLRAASTSAPSVAAFVARGHLAAPRPQTGPERTREWGGARIEYELRPRPREAGASASQAARLTVSSSRPSSR